MTRADLDSAYRDRYLRVLLPIAPKLEEFIREHCKECERIDRISARAKTINRFLAKAAKRDDDGAVRYSAPLAEIQDQLGARIVVFYASDIEATSTVIERYFSPRETKIMEPNEDTEFSYFGKHYILELPKDAIPEPIRVTDAPEVFELQIKTLFQHAWSEANHDLGYKPVGKLSRDQRRLLAYSSAQAWGADRVFDEMFRERDSSGIDE